MATITTWGDLLFPGKATDFFSRRPMPAFEPYADRYSEANAIWLAELCRLVYRHDIEEDSPPPQPTRTSFLEKAGLRQRRFFNDRRPKQPGGSGTQGFLVESVNGPAFAVLVFRGTEQKLDDYITDLKVGVRPLRSGVVDVHRGYEQGIDSVWSDVAYELSALACPVFYTGHSLGAGLATLAAARRIPNALYTFGSSRVGNQEFVDSLKGVQVYRIVDDADIIADLPLHQSGYRHVGKEVRLRAPDTGFILDPVYWVRRLIAPPKFTADHALVNYVDRIGSQAA